MTSSTGSLMAGLEKAPDLEPVYHLAARHLAELVAGRAHGGQHRIGQPPVLEGVEAGDPDLLRHLERPWPSAA